MVSVDGFHLKISYHSIPTLALEFSDVWMVFVERGNILAVWNGAQEREGERRTVKHR